MAKILVTGGAGFMGRWVAKYLVERGDKVWVLDNLSNSSRANIEEFQERLSGFIKGDIKNRALLSRTFKNNFQICIHLAAAINVQESINNPRRCFEDNVSGTFNLLEECRKHKTKIVFVSSALIYRTLDHSRAIKEDSPVEPSCPYTASKIFGENLTLAYHKSYGLPAVILRPFSIYGPYQRSDSEGGVMSIFIDRKLRGMPLELFGDGRQGRDFFYIEDCAKFIVKAAFSNKANGQVFNAGSGVEVKIRDLAGSISGNNAGIKFVRHPHPHAEIMSMRADSIKARKILGWKATTTLEQGMRRTREWLESQI